MKKLLLLLMFAIVSLPMTAQTTFDSININRANDVVTLYFNQNEIPANYLVFIIQNDIMVIFDNGNSYSFLYYNVENNNSYVFKGIEEKKKETKKRKLNKCVLNSLFNDCFACTQKSVFFPENMYKHNIYQVYNYFVLYCNGDKVCEYNLPYAFVENYGRTEIPLSHKYFTFLFKQIFGRKI